MTMNDPMPVQISKRLQHLYDEPDLDVGRLAFGCAEDCLRILKQLHGVVWLTVDIKAVVQHADDIGVVQGSQYFEFVSKRQLNACKIAVKRTRHCLQELGGKIYLFEGHSL